MLAKVTRRLIMQKARRHTLNVLRPLVSVRFHDLFHSLIRSPTTPVVQAQLVWAGPISLAATEGIDSLSFPPLTKMFQFSGYRFYALCIQT